MVMLDQTQESYIAIRFVEPGSVIFIEQPQLVNVHPLQLLAVLQQSYSMTHNTQRMVGILVRVRQLNAMRPI